MNSPLIQTESVRQALLSRASDADEGYRRDLLLLERLAAARPIGLAATLTLSNLLSRYPREADSIARELGIRSFEPLEDERIHELVAERLRLAEARHPLGRLKATELGGLFAY